MNKKPLKIFLADDDEDDRMMFGEALQESGTNAGLQTAGDGEKLIGLLSAHKDSLPDIIFLDLNMPNKNGKECLSEIRARKGYEKVPVVIYSTSINETDIEETWRAGANIYLEKPSSYSMLISSLSDILTINWAQHPPHGKREEFMIRVASHK